MTNAPNIPRPVVRTGTLNHDGAVDPTPPGFRVIGSPLEPDPIPVALASAPQTATRLVIAISAVAALVVAIVWTNSPEARSAAPGPKTSESWVNEAAQPGGPDGTEPLTLSVGWGPPMAAKVDGLKENPYDQNSRAKARGHTRRGSRIGRIRKVDDPKPNPY